METALTCSKVLFCYSPTETKPTLRISGNLARIRTGHFLEPYDCTSLLGRELINVDFSSWYDIE